MAGNYPVGDRIPPSVEEIQQETLDWWHSLEPNEQVRLREKYGEQPATAHMDDYCGYYQKFLRDLPKELVIDIDCGYDFTWRYVLHNNDVVIYTVTVSYDVREVRTVVKHASIAFFCDRNGKPRKSMTQKLMSQDVGIEPIYKQISLNSGSEPGWEYDGILKLGCSLGDTF